MANFEQGIGSGVFQLLDPTSDIVSNRVTTVSSGIWSNGGTSLTSGSSTSGFFQSNAQSASSGEYYDAIPSENFPWELNGLFTIDGLYDDGLYCGENPSCSGCMDIAKK